MGAYLRGGLCPQEIKDDHLQGCVPQLAPRFLIRNSEVDFDGVVSLGV
jgi:hypothetical protein